MAEQTELEWDTCEIATCIGVRLPSNSACWTHVVEEDMNAALVQLSHNGRLDARGVTFTEAQLKRVLDAVPRDSRGCATLHDANFMNATFDGVAIFDHAAFHGQSRFDQATFRRDAGFAGATFAGDALFSGTTFRGDARFTDATFSRSAVFDVAVFNLEAAFDGATFERARKLGPMLVKGRLGLDGAVFQGRCQVEVSAATISCRSARFPAGVHLRARWAEVVLDDADLAAPSILSHAFPFDSLNEGGWAENLPDQSGIFDPSGRPRLLSLWRADVGGLIVAGADLRACIFVRAHHLDRLRLDDSYFGTTPQAWWRTTRHAIAEEHLWRAENGHRGRGWYGPAYQPSTPTDVLAPRGGGATVWATGVPTAAQVAAVYRGLRKGREDTKDEPGAADFYYGEMEMRRQATTRQHWNGRRPASAIGEHAILTLYWLLSGYGLRAWRALTGLTALVVVASFALAMWGFAAPEEAALRPTDVEDGTPRYELLEPERPAGVSQYATALSVTAQATTALLRGPDVALTSAGEWLHVGIRLVGPLLLGLTVLSIRGRVKR